MGEATGKQVKRSRGNGDRGRSETASAAKGNAPLPPPPPRPIERFSRVFSANFSAAQSSSRTTSGWPGLDDREHVTSRPGSGCGSKSEVVQVRVWLWSWGLPCRGWRRCQAANSRAPSGKEGSSAEAETQQGGRGGGNAVATCCAPLAARALIKWNRGRAGCDE